MVSSDRVVVQATLLRIAVGAEIVSGRNQFRPPASRSHHVGLMRQHNRTTGSGIRVAARFAWRRHYRLCLEPAARLRPDAGSPSPSSDDPRQVAFALSRARAVPLAVLTAVALETAVALPAG